MAARYAKVDLCRMLIEQGADINAENSFGSSVHQIPLLSKPKTSIELSHRGPA
jgi:hypothetical protein